MRHRGHLPAGERAVRSRLAQLLHSAPLLRGSVVQMARTCGKAGCKCQRGAKHVSLYLAIRSEGERRMIYVPRAWEGTVRQWVEAWRRTDGLLDEASRACLKRFLKDKQAGRGPREGRKR